MAAECLGARVRLLSRTVTHLYDQAFRPLGVKAAQMNVLVVVARHGPISPGEVGRKLCMEKSTLSRTVERIRARGWLEVLAGGDDRSHLLKISAKGKRLVVRAVPLWGVAQRETLALLGKDGAESLCRMATLIWSRAE